VITFQGESVAEVTQAFHDSVDDYLEFCAGLGQSPEKPYSGQFVLRLDPKLHRDLAMFAEVMGVSLNALIEGLLKERSGASDRNRLPFHMEKARAKARREKASGKKKSTR
jgi:predicted HicB family RNase H-like nuclease